MTIAENRNSLCREQIMKLHKAPLYSLDGVTFTNGKLNITGIALAPAGDPSKVHVETEPNVAFSWNYPLGDPDAQHYYWYWPNSANLRYLLEINLAESIHSENAFRVRFRFEADGPEIKLAEIKDTFYVPKDFRYYQNFPAAGNLSRVQFFDSISSVVIGGYSDCRRMINLARHYGLDLRRARILDWGCGHGRVIRYFADIEPHAELHGVDIDADNVGWIQRHLPTVKAIHGPLMPPLPYPDDMFDFIFGLSVMTHLTEGVQRAWLEELQRISRPGALIMLTFSGDTDVAFSSRDLDQTYIANYMERGRGTDLAANDLAAYIEEPDYYKNVKVSASTVRLLAAPYFDVVDVLECMFGYQDLAVLRCAKPVQPIRRRSIFFDDAKREFDAEWYRDQYLNGQPIDPLEHYLTTGIKTGNSPNNFFDEKFYVSAYQDIRQAIADGQFFCGFEHYLAHGRDEGRLPRYNLKTMLDATMPGVTSPVLLNVIGDLDSALRPISAIKRSSQERIVWFLLPTLNPDIIFGGYLCALHLIKHLVKRGNRIKILCCGSSADREYFLYRFRNSDLADTFAGLEIVNARALASPIKVGVQDRFFAYSAWEAHLARHLAALTDQPKFVFLVQEYEPIFHVHDHRHAIVAQAYDFPHVPIFNSDRLRAFFEDSRLGVFSKAGGPPHTRRMAVIDHVLTGLQPPSRESLIGTLDYPRLVVYARPESHAARNLFPIAVLALRRAIERGILQGPWEIVGVGSLSGERMVPISGQYELYLKPRMDLIEYAEFLQHTSVGLSLMYSPHPGLVSFELAKAGARVVTNTFSNRNDGYLRGLSENIVPCSPTIDGVVEGLKEAVGGLKNIDSRLRGAQFAGPTSWDEVFDNGFFRKLSEFCQ